MSRPILPLLLLFLFSARGPAQFMQSPSGNLELNYRPARPVNLTVTDGDTELFSLQDIHLRYGEQSLPGGENLTANVTEIMDQDDTLTPVVATKSMSIRDRYNGLMLSFADGVNLEVRLYDEGLAYRFTDLPAGQLTEENFELWLDASTTLHYPAEESYYSHNERIYLKMLATDSLNVLASLPVLGILPDGYHIWVSESNLIDFPGLWVRTSAHGLTGAHAALPRAITDENDRTENLTRYPYLADISQGQASPWRIIGVSPDAKGLLNNQLTYLLAKAAEGDFSWVRPGQVAWDWYNANNLYNVDFEAGVNTATYKQYIDFAAEYDIPYVILDEGWSPTTNVLEPIADIDLEALIAYGKARDVEVILWVLWKPFHRNLATACKQFADWGVAGVKVDFMQRDDQAMVRMYREMAAEAAEHQLLVDFHGAYKPAGLHRTYPNVITREGIKGLEWYKFGNPGSGVGPDHDCTLPFTRMVAGPIDYTPGAMRNAQQINHAFLFNRPMSLGTRVHQLAMYVVYESPLQMLADSPIAYLQEPEVTRFITSVPTVWKQTVPLAGKVGDYVVVAREAQNGDWYIGALNDWDARELEVSLDFLSAGNYSMEVFRDGPNHDKFAEDYLRQTTRVKAGQLLQIPLGTGGGWVARLTPQ